MITYKASLFNGPLSTTTQVSLYQKNIRSLTPYLCRYYTISSVNFLRLLPSTASSLCNCRI